jgi:hypothetical protein
MVINEYAGFGGGGVTVGVGARVAVGVRVAVGGIMLGVIAGAPTVGVAAA